MARRPLLLVAILPCVLALCLTPGCSKDTPAAPDTAAQAPTPTPTPTPPSVDRKAAEPVVVGLSDATPDWRREMVTSARAMDEPLDFSTAVGLKGSVTVTKPQLERGLAHAVKLLHRPLTVFGADAGDAGRLKQNYHVFATWQRFSPDLPWLPEQSHADYLVGHLMQRLDRSPKALRALFEVVRPLLPIALSRQAYLDGPVSVTVKTLLATHAEIFGASDWKAVFGDIAKALVAEEAAGEDRGTCSPLQCGTFIKKLAKPETLAALHTPCEDSGDEAFADYCGYRNAYWYYAFWYRRHVEGNADAVREILADVERLYAQDP